MNPKTEKLIKLGILVATSVVLYKIIVHKEPVKQAVKETLAPITQSVEKVNEVIIEPVVEKVQDIFKAMTSREYKAKYKEFRGSYD